MKTMPAIAVFLAAIAICFPAPAHAIGLDSSQARKVADQFVAGKQEADGSPQESHETSGVAAADLDGDGGDEIVVWWTMLGPTYWHHGVTVLAQRGQRYVPAGEAEEPLGSVEGMQVRDGVIQLQTRQLGANDARCCPSVSRVLRYRWQSGRLVPTK